jgi:hypothetical protein
VLTASMSAAFELARQMRVDPFAIRRQMPDTPQAVTPEFLPYELPRESLKVKMIIGHGQFGKVYLAECRRSQEELTNVAVKLVRADASAADAAEFMQEAAVIMKQDHPSILRVSSLCVCVCVLFFLFPCIFDSFSQQLKEMVSQVWV